MQRTATSAAGRGTRHLRRSCAPSRKRSYMSDTERGRVSPPRSRLGAGAAAAEAQEVVTGGTSVERSRVAAARKQSRLRTSPTKLPVATTRFFHPQQLLRPMLQRLRRPQRHPPMAAEHRHRQELPPAGRRGLRQAGSPHRRERHHCSRCRCQCRRQRCVFRRMEDCAVRRARSPFASMLWRERQAWPSIRRRRHGPPILGAATTIPALR
mmetsp:Transcript_51946/g.113858  ORF Transcript_51946/g.113858 Transcript_51946/m.113858 type:complete len:210 (-) Transcript_51946:217-846(-)